MAFQVSTVNVGTVATQLVKGAFGNGTARSVGTIENTSTVTVYLGGADVDTAGTTGYPLAAGKSYNFELYQGETLYGRVATGTAGVRVHGNGA